MIDTTANRHGGNAASVAAFERSSGRHVIDTEIIYGLIERSPDGLTSVDLERILGKAKHRFSGRLTWLKACGRVKVVGMRDGCGIHVRVGPPVQLMLIGEAQ